MPTVAVMTTAAASTAEVLPLQRKTKRRLLVLALLSVSVLVGVYSGYDRGRSDHHLLTTTKQQQRRQPNDVHARGGDGGDAKRTVHVRIHASSSSSSRRDRDNPPPSPPPSPPPDPRWSRWPKFLHQSYRNYDMPENFLKWQKTVKAANPDWTYVFWTDEDNRRLIEQHYPWFLETYDGYKHHICRADAARYFYLYHYGGVYLDLDFVCTKGFTQLVDEVGMGGGGRSGGEGGGGSGSGSGEVSSSSSAWGRQRWRWRRRLREEENGAEGEAEAARIAEAAAAAVAVAASQQQLQQQQQQRRQNNGDGDSEAILKLATTSSPSSSPPPPPPPTPVRRYKGDTGPSPRGVTLAVMGDGECDHCLPNAFMMSEKAGDVYVCIFTRLDAFFNKEVLLRVNRLDYFINLFYIYLYIYIYI